MLPATHNHRNPARPGLHPRGMKNVTAGANPMILRKGIKKAVDRAVECLVANSKPVSGKEDITRVGTIAASDEVIGRLIADAMEKVTNDGVITVEESKSADTYSEVVEGMQLTADTSLPTCHRHGKMEAVLDDPVILITDKKISNVQEILPCSSRWYVRQKAPDNR